MVILKKYFIKNVTIKAQIYLLLNPQMVKFLEGIHLNLGILIIKLIFLILNRSYLILIIKENIAFLTIEAFIKRMGIFVILGELSFMNYGLTMIISLKDDGVIMVKDIMLIIMNYQEERIILK